MMSTRSITPWYSCVPRPWLAHEADGVRVVDHHQGVVLVGQVADAGRLAMMPSIEKTPSVAISRNRAPAASLSLRLQVGHVVVLVAEPLGLAEPDAVDDAGVVQLVGDDGVFRAQQRLEQAAVGVEAGGVEDRVLGAEELARSSRSSCLWICCVPQMKRTQARP